MWGGGGEDYKPHSFSAVKESVKDGRLDGKNSFWLGPMRLKARELTQHGGPPGWLEESDPTGVILYVMRAVPPTFSVPYKFAFQFRADGISICCYIVYVHNHPPSRKESMAWYSSRPMPSLWLGLPRPSLPLSHLLLFFYIYRPSGLLNVSQFVLRTLYFVLCTLYFVLCTVYFVLCTLYFAG